MLLLLQRRNGATEPMGRSVIIVSALLSVAAPVALLFLRLNIENRGRLLRPFWRTSRAWYAPSQILAIPNDRVTDKLLAKS
jgi:hypothetical protein